jgi:hypothetical protein
MDIPQKLEQKGLWFFQDNPDKKYLGVLEHNPFEGKHTLTLYGVTFNVGAKVPCINGEITDGKKASLFNSIVIDWNSGGNNALSAYTVFSFLDLLIGDSFYFSKDEVSFQSLSFQCSNLAEWLGYNPFQAVFQSKKVGFLFEKKQAKTIYSDENVSIQFQFLINYKSSAFETNMKYCPNVLIKAKSNKTIPYWGEGNSLSYYKQVIDSFLDLVIGKKASSYNVTGTIKKRRRFPLSILRYTNNKKTYPVVNETKIYSACKVEHEWFEPLHINRIFLPYSFITNQIKVFFESFLKKYGFFDYILRDWSMIMNLTSYSNHTLPTLLYNLEGLHESFFPNFRAPGIKSGNNIPYSSRLHDIFFNCLNGLFPFITPEQFETIINDLVSIRKEDAHAKRRRHISWEYQFCLILLVEFVIYFLILKQTYQTKDNILNQSALGWSDLKQSLPALLNERIKSLQ